MRRRRYLATAAAMLSLGGCSDDAEIITPTKDTTSAAPTTIDQPQSPPAERPTNTPQSERPADVTPQGTPSEAPLKIDYDPAAVKENASVVPYDTLVQNINEYRGEAVYYKYARVYRAIPAGAYTQLQLTVSTTSRDWEGVIGADWRSDEELTEGYVIQMWGFVRGLYEYETIEGESRIAPSVQMIDYELYQDR
ncbi:hypothetical protein [Halorientalis pallida]|uniref:Lipoprotein n=1 Tax=Halorientalis pallida TaxID=2479928 RepID=A0A498L258_9EURY|nr:hypothetical protein [Halorientalis pallida]RXK48687.1 hypothetical protein EAF64_13530 [Halorientalis pallida]